jgi:hypothetical protein
MTLQYLEDYKLVESDDGKVTGVGILKGVYAGVLYHYGQAQIREEEDHARVVFDYTIVNPGSHDIDDLTKDTEFHTIIGDILTEILLSKAEHEKIRDNDIKEFDI